MRKILIASATALVLTTGGALANDTLDTILASDTYKDLTVTETRVNLFGIKVEAVAADGTRIENHYRVGGTLRKSEVTTADGVTTETRYDSNGNVISTESSSDSNDNSTAESSGSEHDDDATDDSNSEHESSDSSGSEHDGGDD